MNDRVSYWIVLKAKLLFERRYKVGKYPISKKLDNIGHLLKEV